MARFNSYVRGIAFGENESASQLRCEQNILRHKWRYGKLTLRTSHGQVCKNLTVQN